MAGHYEVSVAVAESALLPAARDAPEIAETERIAEVAGV